MSDQSAADSVVSWKVFLTRGRAARLVTLVPDAGLHLAGDDAVGEWKSTGERAFFTLSGLDMGGGLPAGWYHISGRLILSEETAPTPCLYPVYASGAGDAQILLPDPDDEGRVDALVLFKRDVAGLRFCPVQGPVRFHLGDFVLRRVSRAWALSRMLAPTSRTPGGTPARALQFISTALRGGLTQATDALYRDYRQRLLPEEVGTYGGWVARFDTLTDERMDELRGRVERLSPDAPLISVLLPVYQTPERWLRRCIESVVAQVYPHWQLCIVDDASPDRRVCEVLEEYARMDDRIEIMRREVNGHISTASNSALAMARGSHVALLDHDDELRPHALLEMAEAIGNHPDAGLVYSDEDKIDKDGRRFDPYFKPDWNPDLLRSQNFLCHFAVIRTDLVRAVGGFRTGFEGSQDHDLFLRCVERLPDAGIVHVPKVLYHWRAIPGSTALGHETKDYAAEAGRRAVDDHLRRIGSDARVTGVVNGHYRVHWPLPDPAPKVSVVIPTRDRMDLLRVCVQSVLEHTRYPDFEILVVDNQSAEPETLAYFQELSGMPQVRVLAYDEPFNYSAINNWAVSNSSGAVLCLLNNDIEVISGDWLEEMVGHALRPEVGVVGAMLYYPDQTIQHAGVILGVGGVANHAFLRQPRGYGGHGGRARVVQNLSAVTGACLVVRREVYEQVGGLDERLQVAFNDIDFCLRLREAGYRNVWTPYAELLHHESASRGEDDSEEKIARFQGEVRYMEERWGDVLAADPAYNPNLSLEIEHTSYELAFPPRVR